MTQTFVPILQVVGCGPLLRWRFRGPADATGRGKVLPHFFVYWFLDGCCHKNLTGRLDDRYPWLRSVTDLID